MDSRIRYNGYIRTKQKKTNGLRFTLILISILLLGLMFSGGSVYADYRLNNDSQNILTMMYGNDSISFKDSAIKLVTVVQDTSTVKYLTNSITVKDLLKENSIEIGNDDYTVPDVSSNLHNNVTVQIVHRNFVSSTQVEPITFTVVNQNDDRILIGTSVVKQKGINGLREVVLKDIYEDGVLKEEVVISTKILKAPVAQEIHIGTKPETIQDCNYWDKIIDDYVPVTNKTKNIWMKFIMRKETWCDSGQVTPTHTPGVAYTGLYQFTPYMFRAMGGKNIFDGEEQIKIVASMYDQGEAYRNRQWGTSNTIFHQLYPNLK